MATAELQVPALVIVRSLPIEAPSHVAPLPPPVESLPAELAGRPFFPLLLRPLQLPALGPVELVVTREATIQHRQAN